MMTGQQQMRACALPPCRSARTLRTRTAGHPRRPYATGTWRYQPTSPHVVGAIILHQPPPRTEVSPPLPQLADNTFQRCCSAKHRTTEQPGQSWSTEGRTSKVVLGPERPRADALAAPGAVSVSPDTSDAEGLLLAQETFSLYPCSQLAHTARSMWRSPIRRTVPNRPYRPMQRLASQGGLPPNDSFGVCGTTRPFPRVRHVRLTACRGSGYRQPDQRIPHPSNAPRRVDRLRRGDSRVRST
jgi:hypothetical protein